MRRQSALLGGGRILATIIATFDDFDIILYWLVFIHTTYFVGQACHGGNRNIGSETTPPMGWPSPPRPPSIEGIGGIESAFPRILVERAGRHTQTALHAWRWHNIQYHLYLSRWRLL